MKFTFVAHPVNDQEYSMVMGMRYLNSSFPDMLQNGISFRGALDFVTFSMDSGIGKAEGKIIYLPFKSEEILYDTDKSQKVLLEAINHSVEWGAKLVGLGGFFGIIGNRGIDTTKKSPVPLTTGNIFTCLNAIKALDILLEATQVSIDTFPIAVVGIPGAIGSLIARKLANRGAKLILVGRANSPFLSKFKNELPGSERHELVDSIHDAMEKAPFIITSTSSGNIIKRSEITPGHAIIDVAAPRDVEDDNGSNTSALVIDGGRCSSDTSKVDFKFIGFNFPFPIENLYGCLAETMVLALENRTEAFSISKTLPIEKLDIIDSLATRHGFSVNSLYSFNELIQPATMRNWLRSFQSKYSVDQISPAVHSFQIGGQYDKEHLYSEYERYVNPYIVSILQLTNMDKLYVKAEGAVVWDSENQEYLDFVGGYGSVNLGHNHPKVVAAIQDFLTSKIPSFLQIAPQVLMIQLAKNLAEVTPGSLAISFFTNSGAEAVEGALKLAKAATGRNKIISVENSFHGKTFGALSVTGRDKYKGPFGHLMADVEFVQYGALNELESCLMEEPAAAFIVEPIQGEGGVILPPENYLKEAQELCHHHGTLFIVDEIQTGFSRTGQLFASEYEGIEPDILTLAKSLSGGIVPIGAYIAIEEIWEKAYGSADKYTLHTTTFGGNNLAAAAGLAALDALSDSSFLSSVQEKGTYLSSQLNSLKEKYPNLIKEVRGRGLMIGLEFQQNLDGGLTEGWNQFQTYASDMFFQLERVVPKKLYREGTDFLETYLGKLENYLLSQYVLQLGAKLQNNHNILTFATLNNPYVIRIQPPLIISIEQIDRLITALDTELDQMSI